MKEKTSSETINTLKVSLENIGDLYKCNCVNWSGRTSDTKESYTELVSQQILEELSEKDVFEAVAIVTRSRSYWQSKHNEIKIDSFGSNRGEEIFAKRITGLTLESLGLVLDYQVPLKNKNKDKGLGKYDLISFNETTNTMYVIELKYTGNKETLLRASLECYTYFRRIDLKKLKHDFFNEHPKLKGKFSAIHVSVIAVKQAVLLSTDCQAFVELIDMYKGNRPTLKALTDALGTNFFSINVMTTKY